MGNALLVARRAPAARHLGVLARRPGDLGRGWGEVPGGAGRRPPPRSFSSTSAPAPAQRAELLIRAARDARPDVEADAASALEPHGVASGGLKSLEFGPPRVHSGDVAEPPECAWHAFAAPSAVRPAFERLAASCAAAAGDGGAFRAEAETVLRGCCLTPFPEQARLARSLLAEVRAADLAAPGGAEELHRVILSHAEEALESSLRNVHAVQNVVVVTPSPIDALLSIGCEFPGAVELSKIKPMDVLFVTEDCPDGMPHVFHAFLNVLNWRRGPMYRHKEFVRVHKQEREHFPWVIEHLRLLALEYWKQFLAHQQNAGLHKKKIGAQFDAFVTLVTEKLFALAVLDHLPQLLRRQMILDTAGCATSRWRFAQDFLHVPPPLSAVAVAFGIDWRTRRPDGVSSERPLLLWQKKRQWSAAGAFKFNERLLPTLEELADLVLSTPLRHRPFASMLAEMHAQEDGLLRQWYSKVHSQEPVLHVLLSAELVRDLATYVAEALQAAVHAQSMGIAPGRREGEAVSVLCVGSGASRLQLYLSHVLPELLRASRLDVRVAACVPARTSRGSQDNLVVAWPPQGNDVEAGERMRLTPPEAGLTLDEALRAYRPSIVLCACMPPRVDWSRSFREAPSVLEYLLVGPQNSERSGALWATWGLPEPFESRRKGPRVTDYKRDGFSRRELPSLGAVCLGTDDAPGRVGANTVVSFRRHLRQRLALAT